MTDIAAATVDSATRRPRGVGSDASDARVRRRYRSEARFKAYGIAALLVTAVFLVVLLADILMKGLPAFTQHSVTLSVPVPADAFGDKSVSAIRGADYFPITRDALKAAIPGIESRSGERTLTRLLSTGAPDVLRDRLVANPSLIGTTVKVPLLLSDDADLYYKGAGTKIDARAARGTATPSGTSGEITIESTAGDFAADFATLRTAIAQQVLRLTAEADRVQRSGSPDAAARAASLREEIATLRTRLDDPKSQEELDSKAPSLLVAITGGLVKVTKLSDASVSGDVLLPLSSTDPAGAGAWRVVTYLTPESNRKVTDQDVAFLERFRELGAVHRDFNWLFFTAGDSREPELAGIRGALVGTALTLLVTLALCVPIGVLAAVYLEEFAPKNKLTALIEVNINNLAAVPSIVFGLLGLAVFLNFFALPRSAPLVGGLVLALLVLPTIIIAARAALKAVPPSIKEAALGVGASHQQAVFHHVLPLAMPGIMTGTIIGMAHALGETAPLLMIGMIAFIVDVPTGLTDAATVLPVQIYLWSDLPEVAFQAKTAATIIVLLLFLFVMNGMAIWLRRKFERRW
ncbi:MAG: phosphate ABC transporter permease PstA [Rhodospirillales bacterium]|nr:phosphate ABC transporter permease PstA [Rhodospirillales bacterium]